MPVAQCAAPAQSPFVAKSSYVGGPLPESAVTAIVSALSSLPASLPGAGGGVVFDGYGGAINQVAASETAFVHRNAVSCAQYSITYASTAPSQNAAVGRVRMAAGSAPGVRAGDAGLVPELHRPHLGRLAAGLLRIEPASPATGEAEIRPRRRVPFRAVDPIVTGGNNARPRRRAPRRKAQWADPARPALSGAVACQISRTTT